MLALIFLIAFPFLIWQARKTIRTADASMAWPSVSGIVTAAERAKVAWRQQPRVTYSYSVNGADYSSKRISFAAMVPARDTEPTLIRYPVGQAVTVRYNPTDPSQSVLEPGANSQVSAPMRAYITLFILLIVLNAIQVVLYVVQKKQDTRRPRVLHYGDEAAKDPNYGEKLIWRDAHDGNAQDQFRLGKFYLTGYWVAKDPAEGAKWLQEAADQGYAESEEMLGELYMVGNGVQKDPAAAITLFRRSAARGNKLACVDLGLVYKKGLGVTPDQAQAADWFQKAKGDPEAEKALKKLGVK